MKLEQTAIAGYCRISVDEELDRDNTSIENQKLIISDFAMKKFPNASLTFFEDRDRSGYTFEQREGYQRMRPPLMNHTFDILIVKDFSRFARRNSRGLVELEDLRDAGVRIISIGDSIDYPTYDDWTAIQFRFLINEMPVTDASKKVKSVIQRRQNDGRWICAVPYGYIITNSKTMVFEVDEPAATVVREIFDLYNKGWGYKKIANHLTDQHIPTPRMAEKQRKEMAGVECRIHARAAWSIITVQGILENDFYIGTLRQGKYTRRKINGTDMKKDTSEHIVFENNHPPIVDYRAFALAQEGRRKRSVGNYRGIKKYDNVYSGYLFCGDCGSPLFSMSRRDLKPAYTCGAYHKRGIKGCTSHHVRADLLDSLLKDYVRLVKENSSEMLERLNASIKAESNELENNEETTSILQRQLDDAYEELKATKRQRVRDVMKHPEKEELLEQTYDELESEAEARISGLKKQIELTVNKRNTMIQVNRIAKTAIDIFDDILAKEKLDRTDLELIVERITVFDERIEIQLKADIDRLLLCDLGEQPAKIPAFAAVGGTGRAACAIEGIAGEGGNPANFKFGTEHSVTTITQSAVKKADKMFRVSVISDGDPLEIYTDNDGEVIFKKYSPIGELSSFATQYAEVLGKIGGYAVVVCDRDHVISVAGIPKKELLERRVSPALEEMMEQRRPFALTGDGKKMQPVEGVDRYALVQAPIIAAGDVCGSLMFIAGDNPEPANDTEVKLIQVGAAFLGRQMEE